MVIAFPQQIAKILFSLTECEGVVRLIYQCVTTLIILGNAPSKTSGGRAGLSLLQNRSGSDPPPSAVDIPHLARLQLDLRHYGIPIIYVEYGNTQWLWQQEQVRRHFVHSDPTVVCFPTFPHHIRDHTLQAQASLEESSCLSQHPSPLCTGSTPGRLYTVSFQLNQEGFMSLYECFYSGSVGQKGHGNKQLIKQKQTGLFITPLNPFHALLRGMCVAIVLFFSFL